MAVRARILFIISLLPRKRYPTETAKVTIAVIGYNVPIVDGIAGTCILLSSSILVAAAEAVAEAKLATADVVELPCNILAGAPRKGLARMEATNAPTEKEKCRL